MFKKGTLKKIQNDFLGALSRKVSEAEKIGTKNVKKEILSLRVFDTGLTHNKTFVEIKKAEKSFLIRFITPSSVRRKGKFYPIFPYYGLGTNRKYGARPWLRNSAIKTLGELGRGKMLKNANK